MIIDCPRCKKKFEVDSSLVPEKGRLLKCGNCNHTWFFDKNMRLVLHYLRKIRNNQIP